MATDLKEEHMGTKNVKADNWDGSLGYLMIPIENVGMKYLE